MARVKAGKGCEATLVRGRGELAAAVGKDALTAAVASTKFPGATRAVPRGSIHPFVYDLPGGGGGYVVAAPDESQVRRSNWLEQASLDAATAHVIEVQAHGVKTPPPPVPVSEWIVEESVVLALDTEGQLDRISLATEDQSGSWQWSHPVLCRVQEQLDAASLVLAHYAPHDIALLRNAGLDVHPEKWRCTLVAHRLLNPYRNRGLGYAAPMYFPVRPWKHLIETDPELYNVMDAWVLIEMWRTMQPRLEQERLYPLLLRDMALQELLHEPIADHRNAGFIPGVQGHQDAVTRAATVLEDPYTRRDSDPTGWLTADLPVADGRVACGLRDPFSEALRFLTGTGLEPTLAGASREALVRTLLGYGIDAARKGSDRLAPITPDFPTRKSLTGLIEQHPEVEGYLSAVRKQLNRDRFVANPFGRRWWRGTPGQAARFLILSTIADIMAEALVAARVKPARATIGCVHVTPEQSLRMRSMQSHFSPPLTEWTQPKEA